MRMRRSVIAAAAAVVALVGIGREARAESLPELVPHLIEQGGWLRAHYPGVESAGKEHPALFARHEPGVAPTDLLGNEPHIAIVARDWTGAYSLTDGRSLLFDRVRMIHSSRMEVTRVSWAGGRLLPYAEVSVGQWRADTDLVPWLKSDAAAAGQIAAGFELHVASRCVLAWDLEETRIYSDQQNVPATRLFASFGALRAEF
jgi:hypothetical protein